MDGVFIMSNAFTRKDPALLKSGSRACLRNHTDPKGRTVRVKKSSACWACTCMLPNGPFDHDFGELEQQVYNYTGKYKTHEERKKARSAASARWSKRNKEKFYEYQQTYLTKPETKEKVKEKNKRYYENLPEEKKEILRAKQLARYYRLKAEKDEHKGT